MSNKNRFEILKLSLGLLIIKILTMINQEVNERLNAASKSYAHLFKINLKNTF